MKKLTKYGICAVLLAGLYATAGILVERHEKTISKTVIEPDMSEILEKRKETLLLPFGGTTLLPAYRFIALYGSPAFRSLGALGEQDIAGSVVRVKELSSQYQSLSQEKIIPAFEIITTIASAGPTENDDYSQELDPESIKPWINTAKEQGIYVVLDLQPGRSSFADQARQYEPLLKEPHVGLALDPEWRLRSPADRHLKKVGSVTADEINQTSEWLANLTKQHRLPQKMFIVHQFKLSMIENRETLKTNREELAYVLHMDGHGTLGQKVDTWNNLKVNLPDSIYLAWKNFYDEDKPTPTPEQTMAQEPQPVFISYQ